MYQIEEVAKKTNLTKRALRYYEELGLVSPSGRTESGYRLYTDEDVTHILHVKTPVISSALPCRKSRKSWILANTTSF